MGVLLEQSYLRSPFTYLRDCFSITEQKGGWWGGLENVFEEQDIEEREMEWEREREKKKERQKKRELQMSYWDIP
jgi:hypothetical protein